MKASPLAPTTIILASGYTSKKIHRATRVGEGWSGACGMWVRNSSWITNLGPSVVDADIRWLCRSCFVIRQTVSISFNDRTIY